MDDNINKQEAERSTCKRDRHPVDVGLDQVALGRARLAQVLQVLKHLRLGHRCPLEVLELGRAAEPCIVFTYLLADLKYHVRNSLCLVLVQFLLLNYLSDLIVES